MIEQPVEPPRRVAKQAGLLLQVDVDAAEEDAASMLTSGSSVRSGV